MRASLTVDREAPKWAHDFALDVVKTFDRAEERSLAGPRTSKSDFIDRMTDAECSDFDTMIDVVAPRVRQKWHAISAIYHRAPDFADFRAELELRFGVDRAAALLRASD